MAPVENMQIIHASELEPQDVVLKGQRQPYTRCVVRDVHQQDRNVRVELAFEDEPKQGWTEHHEIDDYVSVSPRKAAA